MFFSLLCTRHAVHFNNIFVWGHRWLNGGLRGWDAEDCAALVWTWKRALQASNEKVVEVSSVELPLVMTTSLSPPCSSASHLPSHGDHLALSVHPMTNGLKPKAHHQSFQRDKRENGRVRILRPERVTEPPWLCHNVSHSYTENSVTVWQGRLCDINTVNTGLHSTQARIFYFFFLSQSQLYDTHLHASTETEDLDVQSPFVLGWTGKAFSKVYF